MKPIFSAYTAEVYANLRPLHANWEPTQSVKLGDIGVMDGRVFRQQSHLDAVGITITSRSTSANPTMSFGSSGTTELSLTPEISTNGIVSQRATMDVKFYTGGATFLHLANCRATAVADKSDLKKRVKSLFDRGEWDLRWVVVTSLIEADATTIAIAATDGASFQVEAATSAASQIDLADASLRFAVRSASKVGFQLVSAGGLTPLIGLSRLHRNFFSGTVDLRPGLAATIDPDEIPEPSAADEEWSFEEIQ